MSKIAKPLNPLIYRTAATFAAIYYEAGRSSGMTSKHKNAKSFAKANFEKFVSKVIQHFLELLKPTSNINEHMREEIYHSLIDPVNDPDLMGHGDKILPKLDVQKFIRAYDKQNIKTPIRSQPRTVLHKEGI